MQFAATHHRPLSAQARLQSDVRRTILTAPQQSGGTLTQITLATTVAHLRVGTAHSLFLLDAVGGLHIRRVAADGTIGQSLYRANIGRTGRQSIATYEIDGSDTCGSSRASGDSRPARRYRK